MEVEEACKKWVSARDVDEFRRSELAEMLDSMLAYIVKINASQQDRRCPACKSLLEETSVYCDNCGTDTPRR